MYGRAPDLPAETTFAIQEHPTPALNGSALRSQVAVHLLPGQESPSMHLLIYLPRHTTPPHPVFFGLNFLGNHTIHPDPEIAIPTTWLPAPSAFGLSTSLDSPAARGLRSSRWPVEYIIKRGYGLVTAYYGDLDPDFDDGFQNGLQPHFYRGGQTRPAADEWGAIGAWAWGLRRGLDYFSLDQAIDQQRVAVLGHSRLGKAALWAAAQDTRFALAISNNSGCGGAALFRRKFGETIELINAVFPHWFCANFHAYAAREDALPVDQHMLLALIAPRPLYIASAADDLWADPHGEFLSTSLAGIVYELFGKTGLNTRQQPALGLPIHNTVGYHIRPGEHDLTGYDWEQFLDFADRHL